MPKPPVILTADGKDCSGQTLDLTRDGLELRLNLAADQELDSTCTLSFKPAAGTGQAVELETLSATVSCELGAFSSDNPVAWLLADWGDERPFSVIHVKLKTPRTDTEPALKARIKIFSCGNWLPLFPIDIMTVDNEQTFSPVLAGKALVELVIAGDYPGLWKPASAAVTDLILQAATLPGDLGLTVAGKSFGFRLPGLLPTAGAPVEGFAAAVNAYLADSKAARPVPLHLSAGLPGHLQAQFSPAAVTVVRHLDGNPTGALSLSWQSSAKESTVGIRGEAKAGISLPGSALLQAFGFTVDVELLPETLLFPPTPKATGRAQLATPLDCVAQGFHTDPRGPALSGIDLKLRLRSSDLEATLALHPDLHGRPVPAPYGGAVLPIRWQAGAELRGEDVWLSLSLPRPVQLPDKDWWAVLSVQQGEALWELASEPPAGVGACLYRKGEGAWLPRGGQEWTQTRLRVAASKSKILTGITLQRGTTQVSLPVDEAGRVRADTEALIKLNADSSAGLEIRFESAAAGHITLRELRVVYR